MKRSKKILSEDEISSASREYVELSDDEEAKLAENGGSWFGTDLSPQYDELMNPPAVPFADQVKELRAECAKVLSKVGVPEKSAAMCLAFPIVFDNPLSDQWFGCQLVMACDEFLSESDHEKKLWLASEIGSLAATRGFRLRHLRSVTTGSPVLRGSSNGAAQTRKTHEPITDARIREMSRLTAEGLTVSSAASILEKKGFGSFSAIRGTWYRMQRKL